jgi:hypothetical protein
MSLKRIIVLLAIGLLTVAANAAQIIVPAAGTGAGAQNSQWQSDVLLHNAAPRAISFTASLHVGTEVIGPRQFTLAARNTSKLTDVVRSTFGVQAGTGALVFDLVDRDLKYLAVTSRTYNTIGGVEYGQDVPAVQATDAAAAGEIAVLTNPGSVADRFNFGLYAVEAAEVTWELVRADGTIASTEEATYAAGQHVQYNNGLSTLLAANAEMGDSVYARITGGKAIVYGSSINQSGDPSFVGSNITRDDVVINLGIDIDEDGTIDIRDENADGVLDSPITVYTSLFPAYVRVVATSEFGEPVTFEVVASEAEAVFRDNNGTLRIGAAGDLKNKSGSIVLRATSNGTVTLFTIPVTFK